MKFYGYKKCATCRKAEKALDATKIAYEFSDITLNPPPKATLKKALKAGYLLKDLFNKSGELYRTMKMKDKLPKMSEAQALEVLVKTGKLVKRPIVTDGKKITVGFDDKRFKESWRK